VEYCTGRLHILWSTLQEDSTHTVEYIMGRLHTYCGVLKVKTPPNVAEWKLAIWISDGVSYVINPHSRKSYSLIQVISIAVRYQ
jgi:hypothetical protein